MSPSMGELALLTQIRWIALPDPTLEYRFDPRRRWRFDFAWPLLRVAAEVEGASWSAGRHTRGDGFEKDAEKYNEAAIAGWLVIRMTTEMVKDGRAIAVLERAIRARKGAPWVSSSSE